MPPRSGAPAAPLATATVSRRRSEVSTATPPRASATRAALEAPSARRHAPPPSPSFATTVPPCVPALPTSCGPACSHLLHILAPHFLARSFTAAALGRARRSTGVRGCALRPLPRRRRRRPPVASSRPRVWRCTTWWSSRTPGLAGTPPAGTSPASRTPTSTPSPARPGTFWWESRRRPKSGRGAVCRPRAAPPAVPGGPCPLSSVRAYPTPHTPLSTTPPPQVDLSGVSEVPTSEPHLVCACVVRSRGHGRPRPRDGRRQGHHALSHRGADRGSGSRHAAVSPCRARPSPRVLGGRQSARSSASNN
eukprot:scaffold1878_cov64-Phaeocystis_antarctica.AAC.8